MTRFTSTIAPYTGRSRDARWKVQVTDTATGRIVATVYRRHILSANHAARHFESLHGHTS